MGQSESVNGLTTRDRLYRWLWAAVVLLGAALRLTELDLAPLSRSEVITALAALTGSFDHGAVAGGLLVGLNRALFGLAGASDATARLLPAVVGAALPLVMLLWTPLLGRRGALLAAGMLAISPSLVFQSRQVSDLMPGVLAALLLFGALLQQRDRGDSHHPAMAVMAGLALGCGVAAGPAFFSLTATLAIATVVFRPAELAGVWASLWNRRTIPVALAAAILTSTAFLLFPAGVGAVGDGLAGWAAGFGSPFRGLGQLATILLVYEPLALLLGLAGLVWALWRGGPHARWLAVWGALGAGLALLRPGQPDAPLLVGLPLGLLAAAYGLEMGLREVLDGELSGGLGRSTLMAATAALAILGAHIWVSLGQYARFALSNSERSSASLLLAGVSAVLVAGVIALLWTYSHKLATRSLLLAALLIGTFYSWGRAWEVGHTHAADPREAWVTEGTAPGARILVKSLTAASLRSAGSAHALPVTVQRSDADPWLRWYLRDFEVTWVDALQPAIISQAVITPIEQLDPLLGDSYVGMDLALVMRPPAKPAESQPISATLRWLLLRDGPPPEMGGQVVLWLRQDVALFGDLPAGG